MHLEIYAIRYNAFKTILLYVGAVHIPIVLLCSFLFERYECVSTPFLFPLMVLSFLLSEMLLTCLMCRLLLIKLANIL